MIDTEESLCAEFWAWLYTEREKRQGREPTDEEKNAHPALINLRQLRAKETL